MPSCAGAYVSGVVGSNECPAGSARIEAEAACRAAAAAVGKIVGTPFVVSVSTEPRGCNYFNRSDVAYFNADAVGAGSPYARLLCAAVVTAGAPLHAARCRWPMAAARVHRHAQRHCRVCAALARV